MVRWILVTLLLVAGAPQATAQPAGCCGVAPAERATIGLAGALSGASTRSPAEETVGAVITVRGKPEFRAAVRADLEALRRLPTGRRLLDALERAGQPVTISFGPQDACQALDERAFPARAAVREGRVVVERPGAGCGSKITVRRLDDRCYPPVTTLGHELIHALHNATGRNVKEFDYRPLEPGTDTHEEAAAIGLGAYAGDAITDNALRRELGNRALPRRTTHSGECR